MIFTNLTEGDGSGTVTVGFLDSSGGGGGFTCCLGGELIIIRRGGLEEEERGCEYLLDLGLIN